MTSCILYELVTRYFNIPDLTKAVEDELLTER